MSRPGKALALIAAIMVFAHLLSRACGWDVHTSAVAGMPLDASSWFLGPFHVVSSLLAVTVAPILAFAALTGTITGDRGRSPVALEPQARDE